MRYALSALLSVSSGLWLGACASDAALGTAALPPGGETAVTAQECVDSDGDGYGQNCDAGPDCNDADPTLFEACPTECTNGETQSCYSLVDITANNVICGEGTRTCQQGYWGACIIEKEFGL